MAKYPEDLGPWATRPYGAVGDWDEAKRQCRDALHDWAAAGRYGTYSELVRRVTAIEWPEGAYTHHGKQMGVLLGQVSVEELVRDEDRPVLSALVIGQDEGMPTAGFWKFLRDNLHESVPMSDLDRVAYWAKEFKAACQFYGGRTSPS